MAHQGGKIFDAKERKEIYNWFETLEFDLMGLPKPDIALFLHMPIEKANIVKENREEKKATYFTEGFGYALSADTQSYLPELSAESYIK